MSPRVNMVEFRNFRGVASRPHIGTAEVKTAQNDDIKRKCSSSGRRNKSHLDMIGGARGKLCLKFIGDGFKGRPVNGSAELGQWNQRTKRYLHNEDDEKQ